MPNNSSPQNYFAVDYRSPPSGMGQIIDSSQPEKIGDKWNMVLIDYGANPRQDPFYVQTQYFTSQKAEYEGWAGPVIEEIIAFLRESGVTHVQDSEMAYEYPGADERGFFTLERWADIYLNPQW